MYDKLFLKFTDGELINPNNIQEHYFNKIVIYNLANEPDLFDMLKSVGLDLDQITLFQMIEFLVNIGVENLIIVDLSCGIFKSDSGLKLKLTDRYIRYQRQQMLKI
jgi:hypothetical protein